MNNNNDLNNFFASPKLTNENKNDMNSVKRITPSTEAKVITNKENSNTNNEVITQNNTNAILREDYSMIDNEPHDKMLNDMYMNNNVNNTTNQSFSNPTDTKPKSKEENTIETISTEKEAVKNDTYKKNTTNYEIEKAKERKKKQEILAEQLIDGNVELDFIDNTIIDATLLQALVDYIGEYVSVEFLIGSNCVTKQGIIYNVGKNFMTLYEEDTKTFVVCDLCSIKFVTFYLPGQRPPRMFPSHGTNMKTYR